MIRKDSKTSQFKNKWGSKENLNVSLLVMNFMADHLTFLTLHFLTLKIMPVILRIPSKEIIGIHK